MDKVMFHCKDCEKEFEVQFNEIADLQGLKCKFCKSESIFIQKFIFEKQIDKTPIKTGDRGCGTPNRFK